MATITSIKGWNTDVNIGPLFFTHHAIAITTNPDEKIPCKIRPYIQTCYSLKKKLYSSPFNCLIYL